MKILGIKDLKRKDVPIYYRMYYTGVVSLQMVNATVESRIDFSLEMKPTGQKEVLITFNDPVDYPLVPLLRELKKYILDLDWNGGLPPL